MIDHRTLRRAASLFLLLALACAVSWWPGLAAAAKPTNMWQEFESFMSTRVTGRDLDNALQGVPLTQDDKNGYLQFRKEEGQNVSTYTFVYWLKGERPSQSRVFGLWEEHEGETSSYHRISFWAHEDGKWTHLEDVLPKLGVKDVWDEKKPLPKPVYQRLIQFEYELPQHGTTIKATLRWFTRVAIDSEFRPARPEEHGFDDHAYSQMLANVKYRKFDLVWNRKTGRFSIGAKSEGAPVEEP